MKIVLNLHSFWDRFWSILAPKSLPKNLGGRPPPLHLEIVLFWHVILGVFWIALDRVQDGPRGPKTPQRAPKQAPRGRQERPRRLQEGLKRSQEPVKRAQDLPKSPGGDLPRTLLCLLGNASSASRIQNARNVTHTCIRLQSGDLARSKELSAHIITRTH